MTPHPEMGGKAERRGSNKVIIRIKSAIFGGDQAEKTKREVTSEGLKREGSGGILIRRGREEKNKRE